MDVSLLGAVKHSPLFFVLVVMLGAPAFPVSLVGVIMMLRRAPVARLLGFVALAGAVLALLVGVMGWLYGRHLADSAAASPGLNVVEKTLLQEAGYTEAAYHLWFGLAVTLPSVLFGVVAILGARSGAAESNDGR
jgi:hypothetical protein